MSEAAAIALLKQTSEWHDVRLVKLESAQEANVQKHAVVPPLAKTVRDHETRIRSIERANLKLAGAVGGLCFFGSLGAQVLFKFVH